MSFISNLNCNHSLFINILIGDEKVQQLLVSSVTLGIHKQWERELFLTIIHCFYTLLHVRVKYPLTKTKENKGILVSFYHFV